MYAAERHKWLIDTAHDEGRVSVTQASEQLGVVPETIRRDLDHLTSQGLLTRVHGGAIPADFDLLGDQPLATRDVSAVPEKDRIARAALEFIPRTAAAIVLDAGSTTSRLAALLDPVAPLTIFTDSAPVATTAATHGNCDVHLIGGRVRPTTQATVGNAEQFGRLRVDVAFLGTNGLSTTHGLSTPDVDEAATKAAMVACARRVIVLADSRKIGAESTNRFARLEDVDLLITDTGMSARQRAAIERSGLEVRVV